MNQTTAQNEPMNRKSCPLEKIKYHTDLPIFQKREEILSLLQNRQVVIIAGETGSGKTTQTPLICLEGGRATRGKIGCTQPRRIAATSIARYVAEQMRCTLGSDVGYKIRFDEKDSPHSYIKFMTDGILLAEAQSDPLLRQYDTLIIDEAHERSLNIDFLLGYMRRLLPKRPDLRLIISSATIDTRLFAEAFNAPIVEVSGRLFPVETIWEPCTAQDDEEDDSHYVDAAVDCVERILTRSDEGDVLLFMPTEADIRDTIRMIEGRCGDRAMALPLFSRLSSQEQQMVFQRQSRRKVVVATNIAETSLTVPGIRFVVDSGLARTVRYVPSLRTSRMPIEPVSRASADQRKGRCGRVREGICIRLYSEKEYLSRDEFSTPEIRRTNLAGVILQMCNMNLGRIEEFPFLQPPPTKSISDGYALLTELGAMDGNKLLTPLGRKMARLPLDPHVARMVLQAGTEGAVREITIIASGLSIRDPRERPAEKKGEADLAHKRFLDPMSDFLTYLKLWDAFQDEWKALGTQNRMRRFCKEHFLSYVRMREWHDVHEEIADICSRMKDLVPNRKPAGYDAIHRSLLSGLFQNAAMKTEEGDYRATRGRVVAIFPGSSLHKKGADWFMCHEIVETSRVFARTVAKIDPAWIEELAPAQCRYSYAAPAFDEKTASVRALEQVLFFGLPLIKSRPVFYGRINRPVAHDVFAREGLVDGMLRTHHKFLEHNRRIRMQVETLEAKLRTRRLYAGDDALMRFYLERIPEVTSLNELTKAITLKGGESFLNMTPDDLTTEPVSTLAAEYPDSLKIGGKHYPITYRFSPDSQDDGASIRIPETVLPHLPVETLQWPLPVWWPERITIMLGNLPKEMRKRFIPLADAGRRIAAGLTPYATSFTRAVVDAVNAETGRDITADDLNLPSLPPHLFLRVEVIDAAGKTVQTIRCNTETELPSPGVHARGSVPKRALPASPWEQSNVTGWTFGELPARVDLSGTAGGIPLYAYPGLRANPDGSVDITLHPNADTGAHKHSCGVARLLELALAKELGWAEREIVIDRETMLICSSHGSRECIRAALFALVKRSVLQRDFSAVRDRGSFDLEITAIRATVGSSATKTIPAFSAAMRSWQELRGVIEKRAVKSGSPLFTAIGNELKKDLSAYADRIFANDSTLDQLLEYPRYLGAFRRRIDNGFDDPAKYRIRMSTIRAFETRVAALTNAGGVREGIHAEAVEMLEELKIALFAQQAIKTKFPVSEVKMEGWLNGVGGKNQQSKR